MKNKRAIIFIDGSNFYHNVKSLIEKPSKINYVALSEFICNKFQLELKEIRYYNAVPDISDGQKSIINIWHFSIF
jgi:hypothetical protein